MYEVLKEHFSKQVFLTNKQAAELGITRFQLAALVKKGKLERLKHGVYTRPDEIPYETGFTSLNIEKAVLSFNCALYFQGLSDRSPLYFEITVPQGYNASHIKKHVPDIVVNYVKPEVFELGIVNIRTPTGDYVRAYNLERTICDLVKNPEKVDPLVYSDALVRYFRSEDKDIMKLIEYSKAIGVYKKIYTYIEVLNKW